MARRDALFDLVKSMSQGDKRRFRLRANRQDEAGAKAYLLLFDVLDRMPAYDKTRAEELLGAKSKGSSLSLTKQYLQKALLESLEDGIAPRQSSTRRAFREAEIWENSGILYKAARVYLRAAELAAERHDPFNEYRAAAAYNRIIPLLKEDRPGPEVIREMRRRVAQASRNLREQEVVILAHNLLHDEIIAQDTHRREVITGELLSLMNSAEFTGAADSANPITRAYYHHVLSELDLIRGNNFASYEHMMKAVECYRPLSKRIEESPKTYIGYLHNLLGRMMVASRTADMPIVLEELETIRVKDGLADDKRFQTRAYYGLVHAVLSGKPLSESTLESFAGGIARPGIDEAFIHGIRFELGIYHLVFGEIGTAIDWINRFLHDPKSERLIEMYVYGRLLRLILHLEMDETDLLDYGLDNWRRKRTGRMLRFEKDLVEGLTQWNRATQDNRESIWQNLESRLLEAREEDRYYYYFDFALWARSKRIGKSYRNLLLQ